MQELTAITVIGVFAWFAAFSDLKLIPWDDLVHREGAAAEELACIAVASIHQCSGRGDAGIKGARTREYDLLGHCLVRRSTHGALVDPSVSTGVRRLDLL